MVNRARSAGNCRRNRRAGDSQSATYAYTMTIVIKCMVCKGREVVTLNPDAADDMLSLAHRLLKECKYNHVIYMMTQELADKLEE